MKNKTFGKKYNSFNIGYYIGFNVAGHTYNYNKIIKKGIPLPKPIEKENGPIMLHEFTVKNKKDRKLIKDDIKKSLNIKKMPPKFWFVGSYEGEFDPAIKGWTQVFIKGKFYPVIVYSLEKLLDILIEDMDWDTAFEHWEFNINGSWMGFHTPIYFYEKDFI